MMVTIIFGLFVVPESHVARELNAAAIFPIISLSRNRVWSAYLQSLWALSQIFLENFRSRSSYCHLDNKRKNFVTNMSLTIMILCKMLLRLAVGEISIPSGTCQTKFQSNPIEETLPIRKSMRKRANLIERAKGEVGAITHRI